MHVHQIQLVSCALLLGLCLSSLRGEWLHLGLSWALAAPVALLLESWEGIRGCGIKEGKGGSWMFLIWAAIPPNTPCLCCLTTRFQWTWTCAIMLWNVLNKPEIILWCFFHSCHKSFFSRSDQVCTQIFFIPFSYLPCHHPWLLWLVIQWNAEPLQQNPIASNNWLHSCPEEM